MKRLVPTQGDKDDAMERRGPVAVLWSRVWMGPPPCVLAFCVRGAGSGRCKEVAFRMRRVVLRRRDRRVERGGRSETSD